MAWAVLGKENSWNVMEIKTKYHGNTFVYVYDYMDLMFHKQFVGKNEIWQTVGQ